MDGRTVPKIRTGTDFGMWYRFLVRDLMVGYVVRIFGTDFRHGFFSVRCVERTQMNESDSKWTAQKNGYMWSLKVEVRGLRAKVDGLSKIHRP